MRYQLIAAALAVGLASPAFAQNRTLPAGSEAAAQPPIDWTAGSAPAYGVPRLREGRSVVVVPQLVAPYDERSGDLD